MPMATGKLDVDYIDQTYDAREGTRLSRRQLRKVFHGDVEGESTGEFLMAVGQRESAAYVGIDRVNATVGGRSGSFVLVHSAMRSSRDESAKIMVLPDSGTRELDGLRGELTIAIGPDGAHTYSFEYELSET